MADPTAVAMRLARTVHDAECDFPPIGGDLDDAARALDDAGVREAVEKLNWLIVNNYGTDNQSAIAAATALAALTGTQEVSDG